jgi:hypothetical protein
MGGFRAGSDRRMFVLVEAVVMSKKIKALSAKKYLGTSHEYRILCEFIRNGVFQHRFEQSLLSNRIVEAVSPLIIRNMLSLHLSCLILCLYSLPFNLAPHKTQKLESESWRVLGVMVEVV